MIKRSRNPLNEVNFDQSEASESSSDVSEVFDAELNANKRKKHATKLNTFITYAASQPVYYMQPVQQAVRKPRTKTKTQRMSSKQTENLDRKIEVIAIKCLSIH